MVEMKLLNYDEKENYTLKFDDDYLYLSNSKEDVYKIDKRCASYITLSKLFGFNQDYEFIIRDVNKFIISLSCELQFKVDKYKNPIIGIFKKNYDEYLYIAIDENLKPYVTEGLRILYSYDISEQMYNKVLAICLKIFGEELCRKSALTYAQKRAVFEIEEPGGIVSLTGEFFNGTKRPYEGLFSNLFIHEKGFKFAVKKTYDIDTIPVDYIYNNLTDLWKGLWNGLFLCMQPSGQWWISNGMEFSTKYNGWKRFDSDVYFSPFDFFDINPVDDCTKKYYLAEFNNKNK